MSCRHLDIDSNGECRECGQPITNYVRKVKKGRKIRSIAENLKKLEYSSDIKREANIIYSRLLIKNIKGRNKEKAICYCLYIAHKNLGISITPSNIGQKLGLCRSEIINSINTYWLKDPERIPLYNPICEMMENYCSMLNFTRDSIYNIIQFYEENKTEIINNMADDYTKYVIAGTITAYIEENCLEFDQNLFLTTFDIDINTDRVVLVKNELLSNIYS